jgi:hypothetical protein
MRWKRERHEILGPEVEWRGRPNFIGLRIICRIALFDAGFLALLVFVLNHLGDLREVEFANIAVLCELAFTPCFRGPQMVVSKLRPYQTLLLCIIQVQSLQALVDLWREANGYRDRMALRCTGVT